MKKNYPNVGIITVNFNGRKHLKELFDSVFRLQYPKDKMEVILVDNASTDDSVRFVKKNYPKVRIIKNDVNNYTKAVNLGIDSAEKAEYVALVNNDTRMSKNWLVELIGVISKDKKIAAVGSKILNMKGKVQNAGHYELPNFYWGERGAGQKAKRYTTVEEVPSLCGAAVLYRKDPLFETGLFDEDFVIYGEDVDMALRLRKKGYKLMFVPKSIIYHEFHGTASEDLAHYYIERNRLLFLAKHYPYKLSNSLLGSGYFTAEKSIDSCSKIYSIFPDVIKKLIKAHPLDIASEVASEVFEEMGKIINYENDLLAKEINKITEDRNNTYLNHAHVLKKLEEETSNVFKKDKELSALRDKYSNLSEQLKSRTGEASRQLKIISDKEKEISTQLRQRMDEVLIKDGQLIEKDSHITGLGNQINQLNAEVQEHLNSLQAKESLLAEREADLTNLRNELNNISTQLRQRMDEVLIKDNHITGLGNQIVQLNSQIAVLKEELDNLSDQLHRRMDEVLLKDSEINCLKDELSGIYNSEGFRFVLRPLWTILWHSRKFLRAAKRKLGQAFWLTITIILTPVFIVLSLCFFLEHITWSILKPLLKRVSPKRKIMPIKDSKISLVMPNYNGVDCLRECLPSVFSADGFTDGQNEVLIVDDGSTDGSVDFIREHFPQVRLIQNNRNRGFGFTCNRGVKSARNEIVVLINNDIILTKDFLQPLVGHLQKEDVFAVTPKLYAWDRKTFNWGMHMGHFKKGYISLWNEAETGNGDRISQTSPSIFAIGGAMVFRKSDFLWLGGFDSIYRPNCWEDIDISYQAWKRGLKVLYEPKSLMYHKARATLTYERPKEIKNELLFTWKNITDSEILKDHLNLLPMNFYRNRLNFLKGFFWALDYLPQMLLHRLLNRSYLKASDRGIFSNCMRYYRNFMRRGFRHLEENERKKVLLITPFMPYPLKQGGKIRIHALASLLKDKFDISLLALIHHKGEADYALELKGVFRDIHTVYPKTDIKSRLYPQRYKYAHSHALIDKLKEIQKNQPIDLIQIESNELLYLVNYVKHIPIIYTEHDSSVLFFRDSYYQIKDGTAFSNLFDYLKRVRLHHSLYKKLDRAILLSREDEEVLRPFFPKTNFSFIPTGVDIEKFSFVHPDRPKAKRLIYVGHYPHYPNEDAVIYFIKKIFPRIQKRIPEIEFLIVGSGPTEKIKQISNQHNIRLIPDVEDVWSYLRESAIFVNPIRISAGIKGKVLEAMAAGIPVVSTRVGSSGIMARNKQEILIADTPSAFARAVIKLLKDDTLYSGLAHNARNLVEQKYDWCRISQLLSQAYDETMAFDALSPVKEEMSFDKIVDLSNRIVEEAVEKGRFCSGFKYGPEELHIELTYRCDSKCVMCDLWDQHIRVPKQEKEMTLDEIRRFVDQSEHLKKIKTVVLSGGEPFLRKDLIEISGYFIERFPGISLGILTNGINTKAIIKTTKEIIKRHRPKNIWLGSSLDGIGEAHDRIRGKRGAFSAIEKTIQVCKKEGINITLTFTLSSRNYDQLIPAKRFAESYGIEFYIQFVVPKETREKGVFSFTPTQLKRIEADLHKMMQEEIKDVDYQRLSRELESDSYQGLVGKLYYLSNLVRYQKNPKRYFRKCVAGTKFAMFSPSGDLYFCPGLKNGSVGSIRKEKFDSLWTSKKADSIREFISHELCHCWLVCVVFPVIDQARSSIKGAAEKDTLDILVKTEDRKEKIAAFLEEDMRLAEKNSSLNEREYRLGKIDLESTPQGIGIGAHWKCDANCVFCLGGHPRLFDLNTYNQFFERRLFNVLPKAEFINLCGFGELLLMPRCDEFLDYMNKSLPFSNKILTTNGTALSDRINQRLTEGRYSVQISLHASEKRLHKTLTHMDSFDRIIEQTRNLLEIRKKQQSPSVNLVSVVNSLNIENLPQLVEFAAKLRVDSVLVNYMTIYSPAHLKLSCFFKQKITNRMFSMAEEKASKHGLSLTLPPKFGGNGNGSKYPRCSDPWKYLYVETEGSILPCCYAGAHIGYLYRDDFQEVWNGEFYRNLRKSLAEGRAEGWCKYCYKNKPSNVNDIRSHVSFRPDLQQKILKGVSLK
ncbi:MAG: glycosyltransferase [Candidatus Omnitrophica bacterium]|nr:glycosyltransferase [Candidatus Omnitrophota bacterium]